MTEATTVIRGRGGGRGNDAPEEVDDSLFSRASGRSLFAVSEGQIVGALPGVDIRTQIYLDGTPLANPDGSENFPELIHQFTTGAPGEGPLPGFDQPSEDLPIQQAQLNQGIPVVRTVARPGAKQLYIRIRFPRIYIVEDDGDIKQFGAVWRMEIATDGQPFQPLPAPGPATGQGSTGGPGEFEIIGKTNSPYERTYFFDLPPSVNDSWDLRFTRLTDDSTSARIESDSILSGIGVIYEGGRVYQDLSQLGVETDSRQFSSFPRPSADLYGFNFFRIPHNYEPFSRAYSGAFNGTLVNGWTNNPAWILYTYLTNPRIGSGAEPGLPGITEDMVDVWSFYEAARYCDELVPDGYGGSEPRYTFNLYKRNIENAHDFLSAICQVMRANYYWDGRRVVLSQDRPRPVARSYGDSNVIFEYDDSGRLTGGGFDYTGTDVSNRYNFVEATYINPDTWEPDSEHYPRAGAEEAEVLPLRQQNGYREQTIQLTGCTSRGQCFRACKWAFYTANFQNEILTFTVSRDGADVGLGDVVEIYDSRRAGVRRQGRLSQEALQGSNQLVLDDSEVSVIAGEDNYLNLLLSNMVLFSSRIISITDRVATIADPLPASAPLHWSWAISSPSLEPQLFQVANITEEAPDRYLIEGYTYDPGKFDWVELGISLPERQISGIPNLSQPPPPPFNLELFESLKLDRGSPEAFGQVFWSAPPNYLAVGSYQFQYKSLGDLDWISAGETPSTNITIGPLRQGSYSFRVRTVNQLGVKSLWASLDDDIAGKIAPPSRVENLTIRGAGGDRTTQLGWTLAPDLDVRVGGRVQIRHTLAFGLGVTWEAAGVLKEVAGSSTGTSVPLLSGTYLAKFIDGSGSESLFATAVATTGFEELRLSNVVQELVEHPSWTGRKGLLIAEDGVLKLPKPGGWRADTDVWRTDTDVWREDPGGVLGGEIETRYLFANNISLIEPLKTIISSLITFESTNDSGGPGTGFARIQISRRLETGLFGEWEDLLPGEIVLQEARFSILIGTGSGGDPVQVFSAKVVIDAEDREISRDITTLDNDWVEFEFNPPFNQAPSSVLFSVQNGQPGDTLRWQNMRREGVQVETIDSTGQRVSRSVRIGVESF